MKKYAMIVLSLLLLAGCANTSELPTEDIPRSEEVLSETETASRAIRGETAGAPGQHEKQSGISATEALNMLYDSFELNERGVRDYPDDYAGYYFDGDFGQNNYVLAVMMTDENSTRYDFLDGYEKVRFENAEYSLNELRAMCGEIPPKFIKELRLPYMGAEINMRHNVIELTLEDTCAEEQIEVIEEYVKDKPITVRYAPKQYPQVD